MPTRRDFIGGVASAMAGVAFVSCEFTNAAHVHAQPAPRRREVVVNGRRVKTIDVHAHCAFPEAMALMGLKVNPGTLVLGAERIQAMDAQGIDVEALSINPFWYKAERDPAQQVVKIQNEKLAELCAAQPDRFVAFAIGGAAAPGPRGAAARGRRQEARPARRSGRRQCRTAMDFADPKFHPFWAKAEELGVLIFIHPQGAPELEQAAEGQRRARQRHRQSAGDHDRALAPDLRRHARPLSRAQDLRGARRRLSAVLRGAVGCRRHDLPGPLHYRSRTNPPISAAALFRLPGLHARGAAPPRRRSRSEPDLDGHRPSVSMAKTAVDHILNTPGLSDDERIAILGDTAARLLVAQFVTAQFQKGTTIRGFHAVSFYIWRDCPPLSRP